MKKEFMLAFNEVLEDKQLPREVVVDALEAAMVSAYRKTVNASTAQEILAKFDMDTGEVEIFAEKEVVEDVQDERTEVLLDVARQFEESAELGDLVIVETTPEDFGRVAAQTARQVVQQRIREAEREAQHDHFKILEGEIINGVVQATNPRAITIGLDRKAEGIMPRNQQIRGERFRVHDRVRALLLEVKLEPRGPRIVLSRAHRNFLRRLLEDEVPEIYQGLVEIRSIAREPGYRSKVAVSALQPGIDPVGACVGIRGVRIQAIVRELNDEKIDVIEWNPDPAAFIAKALSPARVNGVYLDESGETKTATVVVPEDQLSLAIGKDGQNARLAAKLTGWRIDIKSLTEAASETLHRLATDEVLAEKAKAVLGEVPQIDAILQKKQEGRPITPEEYNHLAKFVNSVESGAEDLRAAEEAALQAARDAARENVNPSAFYIALDNLELSTRVSGLLVEEGYATIGDLALQMEIDADPVLSINGMGPKSIEEIQEKLGSFEYPALEDVMPVEVAVEEEAVETEADDAETTELVEAGETEAQAVAEETEADAEVDLDAVLEAVQVVEEAAAESVEEEADDAVEEEVSFKEMLDQFEDDDADKSKSKGKYLEYDPDLDVTIVRRRRKREDKKYEDWEEFDDVE
jgi:N utilization substance protein A